MPNSVWKINLQDALFVAVLVIIFLPLYTFFLYEIPYQINTDEITIMIVIKRLINQPNLNWLGLSDYFAFPAFIFILLGKIGQILGGVNLENIRFIHALFGLLIVILSYFFFRLFFSPLWAISSSLILGFNHSLVAISKMAMRDNSGLLLEIVALGLLYFGFKVKKIPMLFLGSLIMGLTFYVYYPARMTIIIWFLFLSGCLLLKNIGKQFILKAFFISILGFILVSGPILGLTVQASFSTKLNYEKEQLLIFAEGRQLQQKWVNTNSVYEGVKQNIINGLTVFNNNKPDYAYIYHNPDHGFVDPLTGILVWIGVIFVIYQSVNKRKIETFDLLNLTGFFALLFIFSFISNKAPNYTRLLVILPFAAYFVVRGIMGALEFLKTTNFVKNSILIGVIILIIIWNLSIFYDFIQKGFTDGNDVGGTARYVEARNNIAGYKFYLSADNIYPYYGWGNEWQWREWIRFFVSEEQTVEVLSPDDFIVKLGEPPFTVFMSGLLWSQSKSSFAFGYPSFQVHNIKPDDSLVAIEVK